MLIPRRVGLRELEDLSSADLSALTREILIVGQAVRAVGFATGGAVEKLNVGALGNIVSQLHVHIVGRCVGDAAWPGPVWGAGQAAPYEEGVLQQVVTVARAVLRQGETPPTPDRKTADDLFTFLDVHGIEHHTYRHAPLFRVDEGTQIKAAMPGGHTKNLFLKDAKDQLWLISALGETQIDLKTLPAAIGSARLSFGSEVRLWEALGVRPGSVTAFALVNDPDHKVRFVLDKALLAHETVNFHPLSNDATTAVSRAGLLNFLAALGVEPQVIDFHAIG